MIVHGTLLRPDFTQARVSLEPGRVRLEGPILASVEAGNREDVDAGDQAEILILPGFTDTHLHLPQFDSIGADGLDLLAWLEKIVFPAEAKWADADFAGQMTRRAATRLIAAGTTGVGAYATVHHAGTRAAMLALAELGLRGVVGQVLMDQQAPAELVRPAAMLLAEAATLEAIGRIEPAVTPRFAVSCSGELLAGAGRLARERGWAVQTHLAETREECELASRLHGGLGYTQVYERAGLLGGRTILGHGIWLSPEDRALLRGRGVVVAHCPTANLFLRAGAMDLAAQRAAGVRIGLGSDVAGGPDVSMVRVARAMIETAKRLGREAPTAEEAWWTITRGNALAMGWPEAGVLEPGAPADLVMIEPDIDWRNAPDPLGALLYGWDDRWIRTVIVNGRVAFKGR
jgi:guanine deaminase